MGSCELVASILHLQEKILYKMCSKKHQQNVENFFHFWCVLPVDKIYQLSSLCVKYFDDDFGDQRFHQYNTRLLDNKYFNRTSECILPRLWNMLPSELKNLRDKSGVKRKIKKCFINN